MTSRKGSKIGDRWVCKVCLLNNGLQKLTDWPLMSDEDGRIKHLITVHGVKVSGYDPKTGVKLK